MVTTAGQDEQRRTTLLLLLVSFTHNLQADLVVGTLHMLNIIVQTGSVCLCELLNHTAQQHSQQHVSGHTSRSTPGSLSRTGHLAPMITKPTTTSRQ